MYIVEKEKKKLIFMHMVKSAGISIHHGLMEATSVPDYKFHFNQRHLPHNCIPPKYKNWPKICVIRDPYSWYKSFYNFFVEVQGYFSFLLNDLGEDGYLHPIGSSKFIERSLNLKDTLMKYPNKARVFRNILRTQGPGHFLTTYFDSDFSVGDPKSMEQFDMSLYEWFLRQMGPKKDILYVPMNRLDVIEEVFEIKIPHSNKTQVGEVKFAVSDETKEKVKDTHKHIYDMIENFNEEEFYKKLDRKLINLSKLEKLKK